MLYYVLLGFLSGVAGAIIVLCWTPKKKKALPPETKLFFYCSAKVIKESYSGIEHFNYLKYDLNDVDENTKVLDVFNADENVEIYIKRK